MVPLPLVPQTAINYTLYGETAFVVTDAKDDAGNAFLRAEQRTIKVKRREDDFAVIQSGLKAGDRLVTSGQVRLSNGSRVTIVEDPTLQTPDTIPAL